MQKAFSVVELLVTSVIVAIIATMALPRVTMFVERMRASEAEQALYTLLGAQKRYFLDNNNYATSIGALDVELSSLADETSYFDNWQADDGTTNGNVAWGQRKGVNPYTLYITAAGQISCDNGSGSPHPTCPKIGH